ncbi:fumarylacetoacetate hydrolase family protein [Aerococcaceae bacterium DSM 111022]|nr:fumarylacetoacetate hydrolase family protein [Aerococcaceae bacterium DSM 111022]
MGIKVVRYEKDNATKWGVLVDETIRVISQEFETLKELLKNREVVTQTANDDAAETVSLEEVELLSPVTRPAQIVCQGANYGDHRAESGLDAQKPGFNTIFIKFDRSITGPTGDVIKPDFVKLLDYEVELGLVFGKAITEEMEITPENIGEYVAGLVIANDVSARDIQMAQGQWIKGKSYETFMPMGPYLYLLDEEEVPKILDLDIKLWVNDEIRQDSNTQALLFKPAESLTELSQLVTFQVGDVLLTGTPGGVAMKLGGGIVSDVTDLSNPYEEKIEKFRESQLVEGNGYLKDGDIIKAEIKSADGTIDLGTQVNKVVYK